MSLNGHQPPLVHSISKTHYIVIIVSIILIDIWAFGRSEVFAFIKYGKQVTLGK